MFNVNIIESSGIRDVSMYPSKIVISHPRIPEIIKTRTGEMNRYFFFGVGKYISKDKKI